jgi:hypothetical protein
MDEQLDAIYNCQLNCISDFHMHICMPAWWATDPRGIQFTSNQTHQPIFFQHKVIEYINYRHPWVQNVTIHDLNPEHIFEGHTLIPLWEYSKQNPGEAVMYVHNKGVCSSSPQVKLWRETLNRAMITDWPQRIKDLHGHDVVGVKDATVRYDERGLTHTSGNFFWATTDYVATLSEPRYGDRYEYERWITSNKPDVNYVIDTNTDHFMDYYGV